MLTEKQIWLCPWNSTRTLNHHVHVWERERKREGFANWACWPCCPQPRRDPFLYPLGPSINDICKMFGSFTPPPCPHLGAIWTIKFTQPLLLHLPFLDPLECGHHLWMVTYALPFYACIGMRDGVEVNVRKNRNTRRLRGARKLPHFWAL